MKPNKLKLNEDKIEFMVFGTRHQLKNHQINSSQLGSDSILSSTSTKNLGVVVDQYMVPM